MPARHHTHTLTCPVIVSDDGVACGEPITVEAWPGDPGTRWDPPTGPEVYVVATHRCSHLAILEEGGETHMEDLLSQLAAQEEGAYDAEMDARADRERERDWD